MPARPKDKPNDKGSPEIDALAQSYGPGDVDKPAFRRWLRAYPPESRLAILAALKAPAAKQKEILAEMEKP